MSITMVAKPNDVKSIQNPINIYTRF